MNNKNIFYIFLFGIFIIGVTFYFNNHRKINLPEIKPVYKISYTNSTENDIVPELPYPGAVTGKEFSIIGKARGYWFFEASFPVKVLDKDGNVLFVGPATAIGDWMTEDFVQFKIDVKVPENYIGPATIILQKDNPSDMREKDASISFPITIEY